MPTPTKYKKNSTVYSTRNYYGRSGVYADTSTAFDIPVRYPEIGSNPSRTKVEKKSTAQAPARRSNVHRAKVSKAVMIFGVFFILCITVLYRYGIILSYNQEIKELESQRDEILALNQATQAKIDKQFEMNEIEKYATEKLGMMKPQSYQVFYIDMEMADESGEGSIQNSSSGALTGVTGTLVNAFRVLK